MSSSIWKTINCVGRAVKTTTTECTHMTDQGKCPPFGDPLHTTQRKVLEVPSKCTFSSSQSHAHRVVSFDRNRNSEYIEMRRDTSPTGNFCELLRIVHSSLCCIHFASCSLFVVDFRSILSVLVVFDCRVPCSSVIPLSQDSFFLLSDVTFS